ncbi:hypothetical protein LY78DRAFT_209702 [Colletotrichum sublineola]|nr:hypothetical protein LY78DRAFT_209702 [Colletotrichum sublineola]
MKLDCIPNQCPAFWSWESSVSQVEMYGSNCSPRNPLTSTSPMIPAQPALLRVPTASWDSSHAVTELCVFDAGLNMVGSLIGVSSTLVAAIAGSANEMHPFRRCGVPFEDDDAFA